MQMAYIGTQYNHILGSHSTTMESPANESNNVAMAAADDGNMRRQVILSEVTKVDQLPHAALVSIATFIPKVLRLLFAAAC